MNTTMMKTQMTELKEKTNNLVKYPSKWNVILFNDDVTPLGFVTYILKEVFNHDEVSALELAMKTQKEGNSIVGSYIKAIAESKLLISKNMLDKSGYPLKITMEKDAE